MSISVLERPESPSIWVAADAVDQARPRSRQSQLGASDLVCERRGAYIYHGWARTDRVLSPAAMLGTYIHEGLTEAARREFGWLVEKRVADAVIRGSIDVVQLDQATARQLPSRLRPTVAADVTTVEDIKTRSSHRWDEVLRFGATAAELRQVMTYARLLNTVGFADVHGQRVLARIGPIRVERIRMRFINRDSGEEFVQEFPYDPEIAEEAVWWLERIAETTHPEQAPRTFYGPQIDAVCDYCPFATACWGAPAGGRPVQANIVHDDADVAAHLADYVDAHTQWSEADRVKKFVRKAVDATPEGRYGRNRLGWQGTDKEEVQPDMRAMIEIFDSVGARIPTVPDSDRMVKALVVAGIAVPTRKVTKKPTRRIDVRAVRE
ncbi:PD-(D/E)XK nuclease family protein [Kitasatospora sp. NPDC094019]|uniref:PD-(D/E)XK nuclease family protein n=1 Tax=Kitasatospora sp. NPDC094019 TaxID=3364091 RepID=UPI00380303AC